MILKFLRTISEKERLTTTFCNRSLDNLSSGDRVCCKGSIFSSSPDNSCKRGPTVGNCGTCRWNDPTNRGNFSRCGPVCRICSRTDCLGFVGNLSRNDLRRYIWKNKFSLNNKEIDAIFKYSLVFYTGGINTLLKNTNRRITITILIFAEKKEKFNCLKCGKLGDKSVVNLKQNI